MSDLVRLTNEDLSQSSGHIFCAWFMANPNGPTAWALGYIEDGDRNHLFYRWMHFTGGRTYRIGILDDELRSFEHDFGMVAANAFLRVHNHFAATGVDIAPLATIPSAIITNGNPSIDGVLRMMLKNSPSPHDWGRALYYVRKYGNDFFGRAGEEFREAYEDQRQDPRSSSLDFLRGLWLQHQHNPSFVNWSPGRYRSSNFTEELYGRWWKIVTNETFLHSGALDRFAEMWVGAAETAVHSGLMLKLVKSGRYTSLSEMVRFFANFHMPILPRFHDEQAIRRRLGFPDNG